VRLTSLYFLIADAAPVFLLERGNLQKKKNYRATLYDLLMLNNASQKAIKKKDLITYEQCLAGHSRGLLHYIHTITILA
jgi:hypothetical protein